MIGHVHDRRVARKAETPRLDGAARRVSRLPFATGLEVICAIEWRSKKRKAALHFDSRHLDVRIEPPLRIAFESITSLQVDGDRLLLTWANGRLVLHLGARDATRWAGKIANPKPRLSKLGMNAEQRVCLIDCHEQAFERELLQRRSVGLSTDRAVDLRRSRGARTTHSRDYGEDEQHGERRRDQARRAEAY
ncbi:MAG TPA: hypothetical protein VGI70_06145 [Polyangiales bacterium]|jgi:hypothetical protein